MITRNQGSQSRTSQAHLLKLPERLRIMVVEYVLVCFLVSWTPRSGTHFWRKNCFSKKYPSLYLRCIFAQAST